MKSIKFTISPDGSKVNMEAEGFSGSGCIETASKVIREFGGEAKMEMKPDFFNQEGVGVHT